MIAEQIYAELDRAGLTPPVHYAAAPHEWRMALERIEERLERWAVDAFAELRKKEPTNTGASLLETIENEIHR